MLINEDESCQGAQGNVEVRHLDLFSGYLGFSESAKRVWGDEYELVLACEIEKNCQHVIRRHRPGVEIIQDVKEFDGKPYRGTVQLLSFGSPCQDLSVAGARKGLAGERSGLFFEAIRIIKEVRPEVFIFENVPGLLSSWCPQESPPSSDEMGMERDGELWEVDEISDFGVVLSEFAELGDYWTAWRCLDLQFFGAPQRRERVFAVGCLGNRTRACQILFEPESVCWNLAPSREKGKEVAGSLGCCTEGGWGQDLDRSGAFVPEIKTCRNSGQGFWSEDENSSTLGNGPRAIHEGTLIAHTLKAEGFDRSEDGTGRGTPIVPVHAFDARQNAVLQYGNLSAPLDSNGFSQAIAFEPGILKREGSHVFEDVCGTLRSEMGDNQTAVAYHVKELDTLQQHRHNTPHKGEYYATTHQANTGKVLRKLRKQIGKEAFQEWSFRILATFWPEEILQFQVHGGGIRQQTNTGRYSFLKCSLAQQKGCPAWAVRKVRSPECTGCPSQEWRLSRPFGRELRAYLSELSQQGTQATWFLCDLREASEGSRILQHALASLEEMGRSFEGEGQSICACSDGRGKQPGEDMLGSRMRETVPCEGSLQPSCNAADSREIGNFENQKRSLKRGMEETQSPEIATGFTGQEGNRGVMMVRRLTPL